MKNFKNRTGVFAGLVMLFFGFVCCGTSITTSHKTACVTRDGSRIGVIAWNGKTALIDAASGKILNRTNDETASGAVVCSDKNEVVAIYNKFAESLAAGRRVERAQTRGKIIGITKDERLVAYSGGHTSSPDSNRGEPLELYLTKIDEMSKEVKPAVFPLERFEGIRKDAVLYYLLPVRLLEGGELLIVAGMAPANYQFGDAIETKLDPEPWGFFLLNTSTGSIRSYGKARTSDPEINFIDAPLPFSTSDGKFLALKSGYHTGNAVAVFRADNDKEIFRRRVSDEEEIIDVVLAEDGSEMALAVKHYKRVKNGTSPAYKIKIYDLRRNEEAKEFPIKDYTPYLIDLRANELIINHYSDSISKLDTKTGQTVWETKFPEQK